MKIMTTGGQGFLLGAFIKEYLSTHPGDEIHDIDCITYASTPFDMPNLYKYPVDVRHSGELYGVISKVSPDIIIHGSCETHVDNSISGPLPFIETNVTGTLNLFEANRSKNIPILLISSDETLLHVEPPLSYNRKFNPKDWRIREESMGDVGEGCLESTDPMPHASSVYAASKLMQEALAEVYKKTWGMNISVVRPCNGFGVRQHAEKFIPTIIRKALKDEPIPVYGTGDQWRDWLYCEDFAKAICLLTDSILSGETRTGLYHVSGYNESQNIDMVKLILYKLGKSESLISYVEDRKGHDKSYALNSDKFRHKFKWAPRVSLDEGLDRTIEYYKNVISRG